MITDYLLPVTNWLWHVPSLLECALFFLFVRPLENRRLFCWRTLAWGCALVLWQVFVSMLWQRFFVDFPLCAAGFFAYLRATKRSRGQQDLYVTCVFLLCSELGKMTAVDFLLQPFVDDLALCGPLALMALNFSLTFVATALALLLVSRWVFDQGAEKLSWPQCLLVLLPVIPFAFLRSLDYAYDASDISLYRNMVLMLLMLLGSTLVILVVNAASLSSVVKRADLLQMEVLLQKQHRLYAVKKSASDAIRRQHHDLKHYMAVLEANPSPEEVRVFRERMEADIAPYETVFETGNEVVDIVMSEKAERCQREGIRLVPEIDASRFGFLGAFDLCALFGNALDNAIEAVASVEDQELREVSVKALDDRGLAILRVRNSFSSPRISGPRWLATTKRIDRENHGWGLESIAAVARSYGGDVSVSSQDGTFVLSVIIPLPASPDR